MRTYTRTIKHLTTCPPNGEAYDGFMFDMWMCGVCLYALTECRFPFSAGKNKNEDWKDRRLRVEEEERKKNQQDYRLRGRSDGYQAFLKRLLCPDVERRYTALDALRDPWLTKGLAEGEAEADLRAILHDESVKQDDLSIDDDEDEF